MTATDDWLPCSARSRERDDPLIGTAGRGERWLLVEIDGGWGSNAFRESRLDRELAIRLVHRIERAGIRPLAIRRTGRRGAERRAQSSHAWAYVDARPGREQIRWGRAESQAELLTIALDGSAGVASHEPIICVCTNGRHDQCCAVRGRPLVAAFARAYPDLTWECSHLGGDRFAPTMMVFPEALMFGRVDVADVRGLFERYRAGRVDSRTFRGRASLSNAAQAAQAFAAAASGDDRVNAYLPVSEQQVADGGWTVQLDHESGPVVVQVGATQSRPLLSTCHATRAAPVREFTLRSIRPTG